MSCWSFEWSLHTSLTEQAVSYGLHTANVFIVHISHVTVEVLPLQSAFRAKTVSMSHLLCVCGICCVRWALLCTVGSAAYGGICCVMVGSAVYGGLCCVRWDLLCMVGSAVYGGICCECGGICCVWWDLLCTVGSAVVGSTVNGEGVLNGGICCVWWALL
jgi:hypothetical protein